MLNWQIIVVQKEQPIHWLNAVITMGITYVLTRHEYHPVWFSVWFYLFNYWLIFDSLLNLVRKLPIQYIGKTAMIDKLQRWVLGGDDEKFGMVLCFKLIIFIFLVGAYYFNY
jgi:hypothetical protein